MKQKQNVGAPKKSAIYPMRVFTFERFVRCNPNQCEATLRSKINSGIADGSVIQLADKKQPYGAVGRPIGRYVMAKNYNEAMGALKVATNASAVVAVAPSVKIALQQAPRRAMTPAPLTYAYCGGRAFTYVYVAGVEQATFSSE